MLSVWILNDLLFKQFIPSAVTGKLSDIAGLHLFPLFLCWVLSGIYESLSRQSVNREKEYYIYLYSLFFTYSVFALMNISQELNKKFTCAIWGLFWECSQLSGRADISDLAVIAVSFLSVHIFRSESQQEKPQKKNLAAVITLTGLIFINTSSPRSIGDMSALLFLLGAEDGKIELVSPKSDSVFSKDEKIKFVWKFLSENQNTPSDMNYSGACGNSNIIAGTYKGYIVKVYSDSEMKNEVMSAATADTAYDYTVLLASGKYYWQTALLFENADRCTPKSYTAKHSSSNTVYIR